MTPETNARLPHVRVLLEYLKALDTSAVRNLLEVIDRREEAHPSEEDEWEKQVWAEGQWAIGTLYNRQLADIEAQIRKVMK
jgi:hypothetical protein